MAAFDAIDDEDIDYSEIPDMGDDDEFWEGAIVGWDNFVKWHKEQESLTKKVHLTIRLDENIVDYFKRRGRGYQSRINAVLRSYVEAQLRAEEVKEQGRREAEKVNT